jgi:hypothetical protein
VRWIDPVTRGIAGSATAIFVFALVASAAKPDLEPSPELLRTMTGIGASFFLAYVIEASWLAERFKNDKRSEVFLGVITGLATCGLAGVFLALVLSERAPAENFGRTEDIYFWWSMVSLGALGLLVAFQPAITHTWLHDEDERPDPSA